MLEKVIYISRKKRDGLLLLSVSLLLIGTACSDVKPGTIVQQLAPKLSSNKIANKEVQVPSSQRQTTNAEQQTQPKTYSSPDLKQAAQIQSDQTATSTTPDIFFSTTPKTTGVSLLPVAQTSSAVSLAAFKIDKLSIEPGRIPAGDKVIITALVSNTGSSQGVYNAELKIDGIVELANPIAMESGETKTISFCASRDVPGRYDIIVGDRTAQFVVTQPPQIPVTAADLGAFAPSLDSSQLPACHLPRR